MTGSIQVKNGKLYVVLFDNKAQKGKQYKWISTGLSEKNNKRKAEQILKEELAKYEDLGTIMISKILFADFIKEWLKVVKMEVRSNSYDIYEVTANAHVIPYFKNLNVSLQDLKPADIRKYFTIKAEGAADKKGLSPNTLIKHRTIIKETLNLAIQEGHIKENPISQVFNLPKVETTPKYYNADQLKELFRKTEDEEIYPAILLAATYGLRRSEVLGLTWKAVNFKERTLLVSKAVVRVGASNEERDIMKSKSSRRTMPLTDDVIKYLQSLKAHQAKMKLFLGAGYDGNDFICKWDSGKPFEPNFITRKFRQLLKKHGLPPIHFHDLRHSSASLLINNGFTLKEVQDWLGHADIGSTDIYSHLLYKSKENMAERVNAVLSLEAAGDGEKPSGEAQNEDESA